MQHLDEVIFGRNAVLAALESERSTVRRLSIARNSRGAVVDKIYERARSLKVPFDLLERSALDRLVDGARHQGVVAFLAAREYGDYDNLLAEVEGEQDTPLIVFLDGIQDPQNLGAIMRTAYAAGARCVVFERRRSAGLTAAAVKAAAGAADNLPACRVANLRQAMSAGKRAGLWFTALAVGGDDFRDLDFRGPCGLVVGGEDRGLRPSVRSACDYVAGIPMAGAAVGSLNASVAAGIVLCEVYRQRTVTAAAAGADAPRRRES